MNNPMRRVFNMTLASAMFAAEMYGLGESLDPVHNKRCYICSTPHNESDKFCSQDCKDIYLKKKPNPYVIDKSIKIESKELK